MSTLPLPIGICNKVDCMFKNFWWGHKGDRKKGLFLKAWDSIYLPIFSGGLGLRRMKDYNNALLAKLGWKILTQDDKTWVKIVKGKYLSNSNLFNARKNNNSSWVLQGISKAIPFLRKGTRRLVEMVWTPIIGRICGFPSFLTFGLSKDIIQDLIS